MGLCTHRVAYNRILEKIIQALSTSFSGSRLLRITHWDYAEAQMIQMAITNVDLLK